MSWKKKFTDSVGDTLRFIGYAFLVCDCILLSLFSLWFIGKFLWRLSEWLDRVIFDQPW